MTELLPKENRSLMSSWIKYPEKLLNLCSSFNNLQMAKYSKYLPLMGIAYINTGVEEASQSHLHDFKEFLKYWGIKSGEKGSFNSRNSHLLTDAFNKAFPIFVQYRNNYVDLLEQIEDCLIACRRQNDSFVAIWKETAEKLAGVANDYIEESAKFARSMTSELPSGIRHMGEHHRPVHAPQEEAATLNSWLNSMNDLLAGTALFGGRSDTAKIRSDIEALKAKLDALSDDETKAEILSLLKKDIKAMRAKHSSDLQSILSAIAALRDDINESKRDHVKDRIKAA